MAKAKKGMTREEAGKLYEELQGALKKMMKNTAGGVPEKETAKPANKAAAAQQMASRINDRISISSPAVGRERGNSQSGHVMALSFIGVFALANVAMSALDYSGLFKVETAQAVVATQGARMPSLSAGFSKEEVRTLTALDGRRAELDERAKRLDNREHLLGERDKEFAAKLAQIRELTDRLHTEREKSDKKKEGQLEQLANVYGSMNPQESAQLIDQLDITIALSLMQRMPEKRMAQILAMMSPERALLITKMLSERQ